MLDLGKVEAAKLRQAIEDLQAKIANGVIPRDGETSMEVARLIDSAEKRIAEIERKDETGREKQREEDVRNLAIAYLVEKEAALNAEEKRQYEAFLKKEHFTKSDFQSLEEFYTNSYDKLTDGGKAEMSTRVWNGVRKKEYEFIELPDIVKEKEAQRLYEMLSTQEKMPKSLKQLPGNDRADFIEAMKAGRNEEAAVILNRESFAENVSTKQADALKPEANLSSIPAPLANFKNLDGLKLE